MKRSLIRSLLVVMALVAIALGFIATKHFRGLPAERKLRIQSLGKDWTPAFSLFELLKVKPFVAKVESRKLGNMAAVGTNTVTYILLNLIKQDGSEIGLYEENPDTNTLDFLSTLKDGQRYDFPDVLRNWERRQKK